MKKITKLDLSIEEIYLICHCGAEKKEEIITELNRYLDILDEGAQEMIELVTKTLDKVQLLSQDEVNEIKEYPCEDTEN